MRATVMHKAHEVTIENVPDAEIKTPTDALIRVTRACICGSDLWPYNDLPETPGGQPMGHEAIGVVEDVGRDGQRIRRGQLVIMPFGYSAGSWPTCPEGINAACPNGGFFGSWETGGAQAEALRIPQADGTLFPIDVDKDDALMPAPLTLSDVMGTGHHAAVTSRVRPGVTAAVIGDGAVGLCGVIAAKRLGAERIIIMGRHDVRLALAKDFGATDIVRERGDAAIAGVRQLTGGYGAHSVLECVGSAQAMETALGIVRPGGAIGRVGVPHYAPIDGNGTFYRNVTIAGGAAPARAYIEELLPEAMDGPIDPRRGVRRAKSPDGAPD